MTDAEREARRIQFQTAMEQMQNDSQSVRDKAVKQVGAVLTKKQKETFNKLLGKPFDLTLLNDGRGPDNPYNPARGGPRPRTWRWWASGYTGGGGTPTVAAAGTTATSTTGTTGTAATTTTRGTQAKPASKTAAKTASASKTAAKTGTPK